MKVVDFSVFFTTHIYSFRLDEHSSSYDCFTKTGETCKILQKTMKFASRERVLASHGKLTYGSGKFASRERELASREELTSSLWFVRLTRTRARLTRGIDLLFSGLFASREHGLAWREISVVVLVCSRRTNMSSPRARGLGFEIL
jgi:hypothetical protein